MPTPRRALAALPLIALATPASAATSPTEALAGWARAYATNDGALAAACYTGDATLWGSLSRAPTVGREAITAYFGRRRPGAAQIGVRFGAHTLREIAPGVAVAQGRYDFLRTAPDGRESEEPSRFSMTLLRGADGVWRIADHHSSRLPAAG